MTQFLIPCSVLFLHLSVSFRASWCGVSFFRAGSDVNGTDWIAPVVSCTSVQREEEEELKSDSST